MQTYVLIGFGLGYSNSFSVSLVKNYELGSYWAGLKLGWRGIVCFSKQWTKPKYQHLGASSPNPTSQQDNMKGTFDMQCVELLVRDCDSQSVMLEIRLPALCFGWRHHLSLPGLLATNICEKMAQNKGFSGSFARHARDLWRITSLSTHPHPPQSHSHLVNCSYVSLPLRKFSASPIVPEGQV